MRGWAPCALRTRNGPGQGREGTGRHRRLRRGERAGGPRQGHHRVHLPARARLRAQGSHRARRPPGAGGELRPRHLGPAAGRGESAPSGARAGAGVRDRRRRHGGAHEGRPCRERGAGGAGGRLRPRAGGPRRAHAGGVGRQRGKRGGRARPHGPRYHYGAGGEVGRGEVQPGQHARRRRGAGNGHGA